MSTTFCALCGVECGSEPRLAGHTAGKKHRLLARSHRTALPEPEPEPSQAGRGRPAPRTAEDVARAAAEGRLDGAVTVIVTTSPVRSDPDLGMMQVRFSSLACA